MLLLLIIRNFCFLFLSPPGTITACIFGVYSLKDTTVTTCLNDTAKLPLASSPNYTGSEAIAFPQTIDRNHNAKTPLTSANGGNFSKLVYDVEVVINDDSIRRSRLFANSNFTSTTASINNNDNSYNSATTDHICSTRKEERVVYNDGGECKMNNILISQEFAKPYHKVYISFYIICFVAVIMLYFMIYRSVVKRRAWRRKQKSWTHSPMTATHTAQPINTTKAMVAADHSNMDGENMELHPKVPATDACDGNDSCSGSGNGNNDVSKNNLKSPTTLVTSSPTISTTTTTYTPTSPSSNTLAPPAMSSHNTLKNGTSSNKNGGGGGDGGSVCHSSGNGGSSDTNSKSGGCSSTSKRLLSASAEKKTNRERRDFNFLANIRTAVMLFVVTLVFIISFLPAWLMATFLIDYHVFVFYMYFIYNVANPVIYAFMNQSFRKELARVFQRGTHFFRTD